IDTLKGIFLYDIGKAYTYQYNKYDSAIFYYKQVIPYFPDKRGKYNVYSVREIMDRYSDLGNKDSSFAYMDKLKALIDTMPDSSPRKISLSQNIAVVYQGFGMYRTAIRYFQVAINGNRQNKNFRGLGLALANLGELYNQMEDVDKAILTSREALLYLRDVNMPYMQTASNIADFYTSQQQYDSAMLYLKISNDVVEKINDEETKISNLSILARIYTARREYTKAKNILDESISLLSATDNSWTLCRVLLNYSDLDTSLRQFDKAKMHLGQVLNISKANEFRPFTVLALQKLAKIYSETNDYKSSLQYQLEYMKLKDSIATSKSKSDLNDLEISYKTLQKEQEIALLKKDNDIKNLQIKNAGRMKVFYLSLLGFSLLLFFIIYYQRNKRTKIQAQKIRAELETQILRSQMNPHFIFNSLNSIENFIMKNEKRLASDYLNKFSRLIRSILDSSRDELVPVAKDMEVLRLYTDLEQLRFNNKFSCHIYTDPQLMQGDYVVPSLLIQPYVENAIVHGIAHSHMEQLQLSVTATLEGGHIRYIIQDNGVGRVKADEYNRQNKPGHKSVGLQITADRIAHFNHEYRDKAVKVIDLYDDKHEPCGTKVEIFLKAV
ncbi:MAG TPA: histidine kinase, partial [Chitinophagaceae bacterium]